MNKELEKVNVMYREIQSFIDPSYDDIRNRTEVQQAKLQIDGERYSQIYNLALENLKLILPNLSTSEINEGYKEGCRLLQRGLSGYMADHFHTDYVPTMVNAVRQPDLHTAWIFLQALANNLDNNITSLVLEALDIQGLIETALSIVEQLNIIEALPKVQELMTNDDPAIALLATDISKRLES